MSNPLEARAVIVNHCNEHILMRHFSAEQVGLPKVPLNSWANYEKAIGEYLENVYRIPTVDVTYALTLDPKNERLTPDSLKILGFTARLELGFRTSSLAESIYQWSSTDTTPPANMESASYKILRRLDRAPRALGHLTLIG